MFWFVHTSHVFSSLFWLVLNVGLLIKKQHIHKYKISVVEMRMLRWVSENTWKDWIQNEEIPLKIRVTHIVEKMRWSDLRWFDYIQRRAINALVRKMSRFRMRKQKKVEEDMILIEL